MHAGMLFEHCLTFTVVAAMASSSSLYGDRDPAGTKTKHKPINSSTSLAFSSSLSSLIASSKSKPSTDTATKAPSGKTASSAPKASLFTAHREAKNPKKRARDDEQQHKTSLDVGRTDESDLARSKRKMLEKTRLYNAMKRGEYIGREDYDDRGLVDFDKKWADTQTPTSHADNDSHADSDSDDASDSDPTTTDPTAPPVHWLDEFGRQRSGTAAQKRQFERSQRIAAAATAAFADTHARPSAPSNLIHGDTVQHAAFNPDTVVSERMAALAAKRDRSPTPPEATHYDGRAEVRTKGTGFFAFSRGEEIRQEEMGALERERAETERKRQERVDEKERRRKEIEERRRIVAERRQGREVDAFLEGLEIPPGEHGGGGVEGNGDAVAVEGEAVDQLRSEAENV